MYKVFAELGFAESHLLIQLTWKVNVIFLKKKDRIASLLSPLSTANWKAVIWEHSLAQLTLLCLH